MEVDSPKNNNKSTDNSVASGKEDEEDLDVDEISIDGELYYTNDKHNGTIFKREEDGEVGKEVGHFEDGHAFFS